MPLRLTLRMRSRAAWRKTWRPCWQMRSARRRWRARCCAERRTAVGRGRHWRCAGEDQPRRVWFPRGPGESPLLGPFDVVKAQLTVSQALLDVSAIERARAGGHRLAAARLSRSTRVTCRRYLCGAVPTGCGRESRVEAAQAELRHGTGRWQAGPRHEAAGTVPGIDVLRADVAARRATPALDPGGETSATAAPGAGKGIGLPLGDGFELADACRTSRPPLNPVPACARTARPRPARASGTAHSTGQRGRKARRPSRSVRNTTRSGGACRPFQQRREVRATPPWMATPPSAAERRAGCPARNARHGEPGRRR